MSSNRQIVREISYAHSAATRSGRTVIRTLENCTGRLGLIRRARGYEAEMAAGASFWEVMIRRYGLSLEVTGGALENIPAEGPVVVIANHPYGVLDGLMMGHILAARRSDFRIMAHEVFRRARDLEETILPVSFDATKAALRMNVDTRRAALAHLQGGGALGIFPGGTVSTARRPFGRPMDPAWRSFTAKMIARSDAAVVPVYFEGHNSRLFQLASHLHTSLRMGLLISEFRARVGAPVRAVIGAPLPPETLAPLRNDPRAMMRHLRSATYQLSPQPIDPLEHGMEFDDKWRE